MTPDEPGLPPVPQLGYPLTACVRWTEYEFAPPLSPSVAIHTVRPGVLRGTGRVHKRTRYDPGFREVRLRPDGDTYKLFCMYALTRASYDGLFAGLLADRIDDDRAAVAAATVAAARDSERRYPRYLSVVRAGPERDRLLAAAIEALVACMRGIAGNPHRCRPWSPETRRSLYLDPDEYPYQ